jgi:hypothetical protein
MRSKIVIALCTVLLSAACASSGNRADAPAVTVQLTPVNQSSDIFYFPGPIALQYEVSITNPTDEPLTLRRMDLHTEGGGAYFLRTSSTPMNVTVKPRGTTTFGISAWGRSPGGYLRSTEPVTLRTTSYFGSPKGDFVRINTQMIQPQ